MIENFIAGIGVGIGFALGLTGILILMIVILGFIGGVTKKNDS